jgi:hypothetical protein
MKRTIYAVMGIGFGTLVRYVMMGIELMEMGVAVLASLKWVMSVRESYLPFVLSVGMELLMGGSSVMMAILFLLMGAVMLAPSRQVLSVTVQFLLCVRSTLQVFPLSHFHLQWQHAMGYFPSMKSVTMVIIIIMMDVTIVGWNLNGPATM